MLKKIAALTFLTLTITFYVYFSKNPSSNNTQTTKPSTGSTKRIDNRITENDIKILESIDDASVYQIHTALRRRAQFKDPIAHKAAKQLITHDSEWVRSAAFEAIGYFTEDIQILKTALADKSEKVVTHALRGLGAQKSKKRQQVIEGFLSNKGLSLPLEAEATKALFKAGLDPKRRPLYLSNLMDSYSENFQRNNSEKALLTIINLGPREPLVLDWLETMIYTKKNNPSRALQIEHLGYASKEKSKQMIRSLRGQNKKVDLTLLKIASWHCLPIDLSWGLDILTSIKDDYQWQKTLVLLFHTQGGELFDQLKQKKISAKRNEHISQVKDKISQGLLKQKCP